MENDQALHISLDAPTLATHSTSVTPSLERRDDITTATEKVDLLTSVRELSPNDVPAEDPTPTTDSALADGYGDTRLTAPHGLVAKDLTDISERHVAIMLSQFKSLVVLCIAPEEDRATLETQAARSLQREMEWQALVKAAEDLLKLTRELKELWLAGPLRGIGEGDGDGDMAENAKKVQELVDGIAKKAREMGVGNDGKLD